MAYTGSWPYTTTHMAGTSFTSAYAPSTTGDGLAQAQLPFAPGTTIFASSGGKWQFVRAAGTINVGDCVVFQGDAEAVAPFTAVQLTSTNGRGKTGQYVGLSACAAVSGNYLWVCRSGIFPAANLNTTTPTSYSALHSSGTAGQLTATAVGGTSVAITGVTPENAAQILGGNPALLTEAVIGAND